MNIDKYIGQKFNRLTILELDHKIKKHKYYKCICDCGNIKIISLSKVKYGYTKSCGCYKSELFKNLFTKHNMSKTRFYGIWKKMKRRCYNKNDKFYNNYGGRGIKVCDYWLKFENFRDDMYESYLKHVEEFGEKETTIDRIDSCKNYYKENCKWATYLEQANNTRNLKYFKAISPDGEEFISKNQSKFAREHNLNSKNINSCLKNNRFFHKGWTFEYID